jgi:hypothetical protein
VKISQADRLKIGNIIVMLNYLGLGAGVIISVIWLLGLGKKMVTRVNRRSAKSKRLEKAVPQRNYLDVSNAASQNPISDDKILEKPQRFIVIRNSTVKRWPVFPGDVLVKSAKDSNEGAENTTGSSQNIGFVCGTSDLRTLTSPPSGSASANKGDAGAEKKTAASQKLDTSGLSKLPTMQNLLTRHHALLTRHYARRHHRGAALDLDDAPAISAQAWPVFPGEDPFRSAKNSDAGAEKKTGSS